MRLNLPLRLAGAWLLGLALMAIGFRTQRRNPVYGTALQGGGFGIAYMTTSMRADAGVGISASPNPYTDNGIKLFGSDGFKLPDDDEIEIERLMRDDESSPTYAPPDRIGRSVLTSSPHSHNFVLTSQTKRLPQCSGL